MDEFGSSVNKVNETVTKVRTIGDRLFALSSKKVCTFDKPVE